MKLNQDDDRNRENSQREYQYLVRQAEVLCWYYDVPMARSLSIATIAGVIMVMRVIMTVVMIAVPIPLVTDRSRIMRIVVMRMLARSVRLKVKMGNVISGMPVPDSRIAMSTGSRVDQQASG